VQRDQVRNMPHLAGVSEADGHGLQVIRQEAGDDAAFIAKALGTIARAKGMSEVARDTGLGRGTGPAER
jgi:probable addiction module antidote protein